MAQRRCAWVRCIFFSSLLPSESSYFLSWWAKSVSFNAHTAKTNKKCWLQLSLKAYIYIYPGVSAGCPPFSCLQVSWLSTCWSAGCPRTGSHYKRRGFWQSLEWTVEMWFWWKLRLWCCLPVWLHFRCGAIVGSKKIDLVCLRLLLGFPAAWPPWCCSGENAGKIGVFGDVACFVLLSVGQVRRPRS